MGWRDTKRQERRGSTAEQTQSIRLTRGDRNYVAHWQEAERFYCRNAFDYSEPTKAALQLHCGCPPLDSASAPRIKNNYARLAIWSPSNGDTAITATQMSNCVYLPITAGVHLYTRDQTVAIDRYSTASSAAPSFSRSALSSGASVRLRVAPMQIMVKTAFCFPLKLFKPWNFELYSGVVDSFLTHTLRFKINHLYIALLLETSIFVGYASNKIMKIRLGDVI